VKHGPYYQGKKTDSGCLRINNRVLRRIFGPSRDEIIGGWRNLQIDYLRNLNSLPIKLEISSQGGWDGQGIYHAWKKSGKHTVFLWESQKEGDH
jgi:hypothetical protein